MALNVLPSALPLDSIFVPNSMRFDEDLFEELVLALKSALGPCSGLTSDDIDVTFLTRLMKLYDARDRNWSKYAFGDASRGYTRNLVDEGNGKSNLVCRSSPIWSGLSLLESSVPLPALTRLRISLCSSGRPVRAVPSMTTAMPTVS